MHAISLLAVLLIPASILEIAVDNTSHLLTFFIELSISLILGRHISLQVQQGKAIITNTQCY